MELNDLSKTTSFYCFFEIIQKVAGDRLLKWVGIPSWMTLISSLVICIISAIKCSHFKYYGKLVFLIGFLISFDNFIKIYINLNSSSNLKEVVSQNAYMVFGNLIACVFLKYKYKKQQVYAMLAIVILAVVQVFYPVPSRALTNLGWRDLFNCLGSISNAIAFLLYKLKIEKDVVNNWDYTFSLSMVILIFSNIYYATDMLFFNKINVLKFNFLYTVCIMALNGTMQIFFLKLSFLLNPISLLTASRVVCFFSSFLSDYINVNYTSTVQFLLAAASMVACNALLYYDSNVNFFEE